MRCDCTHQSVIVSILFIGIILTIFMFVIQFYNRRIGLTDTLIKIPKYVQVLETLTCGVKPRGKIRKKTIFVYLNIEQNFKK